MKIVLAQCNFTVGDFDGNFNKIVDILEEYGSIADMLVFPEMSFTGYYPMDLIERPGFFERQNRALRDLLKVTEQFDCVVVIGGISENKDSGKPFRNSLFLIKDGRIIFDYSKKLLPNYNIFDERRHFEPGTDSGIFEYQGKTIGFLICEDGWGESADSNYDSNPLKEFDNKIDLLVSINASPASEGKQKERIDIYSENCKRLGAGAVYVNMVGGNDEIVFDGNSFYMSKNGEIKLKLAAYAEDVSLIDTTLIGEMKTVDIHGANIYEDFYRQIILGLKDYVEKCGFRGVVIGSSGGIDSALTIALAVAALGAENVIAVTMPGPFSSGGSVGDSESLCSNLGVRLFNVSIVDAYHLAQKRFTDSFGGEPGRLTKENMQARIRGQIIMEYSNNFGHLPLSTGNKSEMSVGYATLYGDMNGGLNLIGDLYKTEVYGLSQYINRINCSEIIPDAIIEKEPSAELSEGQKDSDSLPEYELLDAVLKLYIEGEFLDNREIADINSIIDKYNFKDIASVMKMVDRAEYKRRQAPPIIRVHKRSFGCGRRLPIVQKFVSEMPLL
ncbi:MAG: NAD+ synthase [Gammaproteobacteria bacterium]|nr:MAG: NAD+ synthase [Gammaproteobacteria bacterium]